MKANRTYHLLAIALLGVLVLTVPLARAADPLPSWKDGKAKQSILDFVAKVTTPGSPDFVPAAERIATFDNDGTLWCEKPLPVQLYFALDRVKALAPQHPEWKNKAPFKQLLSTPKEQQVAVSEREVMDMVMATHTGMTSHEFEKIVKDWIATARHPQTGRRYTEMVYSPMLELLAHLRTNGFKTYLVSGGGIEFMRAWAEAAYGIPPEQIIGSSVKMKYELRDGQPVLVRLPELNFNDDKEGKPVGINQHIGRKPLLAAGNVCSGGDIAMLRYSQSRPGATLQLVVNHDDAAREFAYAESDNASLKAAAANGWAVVSMKNDWKQVFPAQSSVTAIDILLEPDATMLQQCEANNARLLKVFPKGFALDATHTPHVTMIQRFVRTADLDQVYTAAGQVLARANVLAMKLDAFKYYYIPSGANGLAGICAKPTPELLKLQADLIAAVAPFTVETGDSAAFATTPDDPIIDPALIAYVAAFVPKGSGDKFNPHVTTGVAPREYLDQMLVEPFAPFTFSPTGAAVYQLGQFGTAAKKLKQLDLKP